MTQQISSSTSVLSGGGSVKDFKPQEVKILVVEENRTSLAETQDMLVSLSYQVKTTTSREEAQKAIKATSQGTKTGSTSESIDIMLVEERLAYGGKAAARLLSCAMQHGVGVVITVNKDDKASVLRALDAGAVQALPRPLRRYQLAKLWHHAYRRRLQVATSSNSVVSTGSNKRSSAAMTSSSNSSATLATNKEHKDENVDMKEKAASTTSVSGAAPTTMTSPPATATPPPSKKMACGSQVRGCHSYASGLSTLSDREMLLVNEELRKLMPNPEDISKSLANSRAENLLLDHASVTTSSLTSGSGPTAAPMYDIPMMGDSSSMSISMEAEISLMEADMASSLIRCDDVGDSQKNVPNTSITGMSSSSSFASLMSTQAQSSTSGPLCEFPNACDTAPQTGAVWGVPVSSAHIPNVSAGQVTAATAGHPASQHVNLFGFGGSFFTPAQDPWGAPVSLSVAAQCQALAAAKKTRTEDVPLAGDMVAKTSANNRMFASSVKPQQATSSSSLTAQLSLEPASQPALGLKLKKSPSLLNFISKSLQATQACS